MIILGISAFYHDAAAGLIIDGEIIAAAQQERFSRKKHDEGFPAEAIGYCLSEAGISINEVDAIAFYDKPFLKFERLLQTYFDHAPKGFLSFLKSMPAWLNEKLFLRDLLNREFKKIGLQKPRQKKWYFPEHHLSHAASAFYPSPYKEAAILTIDGVGEWSTASICKGNDNKIEVIKEMHFPHSVGLLYSSFTYFLGFKVNSGEYKLMGLAPYGIPDSKECLHFIDLIKSHLVRIHPDGSIQLNMDYFQYPTGLKMVDHKKWESLFNIKKRNSESDFNQNHSNLALAIQIVTEEIVRKMALSALSACGSKNLCMAGGVALNCVSNGKLLDLNELDNLFITPASGDAGGALGAALAAYYCNDKKREIILPDALKGSLLGPKIEDKEAIALSYKYGAVFTPYQSADLIEKTVQYLEQGKVIGWIQGRMEFGPRALGARSIIADPRNTEMQKQLNLKIKFRESFRPFAPIVKEEAVQEIFDIKQTSPYMLLVRPVLESIRKNIPKDYNNLALKEKLYIDRSELPAITHVDFSARIQSVSKETNQLLWSLLNKFGEKTGFPVLVNTSFNVRGEPIVNTAENAYTCFMRTNMDVLVINNMVFEKENQPQWTEEDHWKEEFVLD